MTSRVLTIAASLLCIALARSGSQAATESKQHIQIRGHDLPLVISGSPEGQPVLLSSGDGGWIHVAPYLAQGLAARGFHVVGFDTRAYLESFTTGETTLSQDDVRADYESIVAYAAGTTRRRPILIGVSEGAGLSVLAATGSWAPKAVSGLVVVGLPNVNELAWRWKDAVIYLTHGVPREPTFRVDELIGNIGALPLAALHSTNDEFAPLSDVEAIIARARQPRRLWTVSASDHGFSDNLEELDRCLDEAVAWIGRIRRP